MGIREDFFIDVGRQMASGNIAPTTLDKDLLWAAKWMAERCERALGIPDSMEGSTFNDGYLYGRAVGRDEIRQLVKEME